MAKLKTETNTVTMERRILAAARASLGTELGKFYADFEHGQWWITRISTGDQWSVVDAEGGSSVDGFDFELVTEGDNG